MKIVVMRNLIDGLRRRLRPRVSRPGRLKELALQGVLQASPDSASVPSTNLAQPFGHDSRRLVASRSNCRPASRWARRPVSSESVATTQDIGPFSNTAVPT